MTMTKADLVELVADKVDVPRKKADELVQVILDLAFLEVFPSDQTYSGVCANAYLLE